MKASPLNVSFILKSCMSAKFLDIYFCCLVTLPSERPVDVLSSSDFACTWKFVLHWSRPNYWAIQAQALVLPLMLALGGEFKEWMQYLVFPTSHQFHYYFNPKVHDFQSFDGIWCSCLDMTLSGTQKCILVMRCRGITS